MALDAQTGRMILFGGMSGDPAHGAPRIAGDTWSWDGKAWSNITPSTGPSPRYDAGAAYDPVRRVVVLRGGVGGSGAQDETWTWTGSRWLLMSPARNPAGWSVYPAAQPIAWDGQLERIVLFNYTKLRNDGFDVPDTSNELWSWDGATWAQLPTAGTPPTGYGQHPAAIAFDSAAGNVVFFGHGEGSAGTPMTWTFDGSAWKLASTSGPSGDDFSMTYDDAHGQILLLDSNGNTWTWDGASWTARNPVHSPGPRTGEAMAYDSARHVVVLFGGTNYDRFDVGNVLYGDTWTWNGADWTRVA